MLLVLAACGGTNLPPPPALPPQTVVVREPCLGDPRLPPRPQLVLTTGWVPDATGGLRTSKDDGDRLTKYAADLAYYFLQLDALCGQPKDQTP